MSRKDIGNAGEAHALTFLKNKGYTIVARNWRSRLGEIDLICQEGETLVFVEVKTVIKKSSYFQPEDNLTRAKERKLKELALTYLNYKHLGEVSYQIDLVAIDVNENGEVGEIRHYPCIVEE